MRLAAFFISLAILLCAQQDPVNLNFEEAGPQGLPTGWASSPGKGYSVTTVDDCGISGSRCAVVRREAAGAAANRAYIPQSFDATARAADKCATAPRCPRGTTLSGAQIFFRVDRPSGVGFSKYSPLQETRATDWSRPETVGTIDPDAAHHDWHDLQRTRFRALRRRRVRDGRKTNSESVLHEQSPANLSGTTNTCYWRQPRPRSKANRLPPCPLGIAARRYSPDRARQTRFACRLDHREIHSTDTHVR